MPAIDRSLSDCRYEMLKDVAAFWMCYLERNTTEAGDAYELDDVNDCIGPNSIDLLLSFD